MSAQIDPNIRVFIAALRGGKASRDALRDYCWAKMAVPINDQDLSDMEDPFLCPPRLDLSMSGAMGADAFDDGGTDQEIAKAFAKGLVLDRKRGVLWRVTKDSEHPTHGQLLPAMSAESVMEAGRLLGYGQVAQALVSR